MTAEKKKGKYIYYRCTGFKGACGNIYIREERLADLLGEVIRPIQITEEIAAGISAAMNESDGHLEQQRATSLATLEQRRRAISAKMDRAYDDFLSDKISEDFWKTKSNQWEAELVTIDRELDRLRQEKPGSAASAEKILELAKNAHFLYQSQDSTEQARLLKTVLSNCTFDCGSVCPTYASPFDLLVKGNETGNWRGVWDGFRNWVHAILELSHCGTAIRTRHYASSSQYVVRSRRVRAHDRDHDLGPLWRNRDPPPAPGPGAVLASGWRWLGQARHIIDTAPAESPAPTPAVRPENAL